MELETFCERLDALTLSIPEKALALLWYYDESEPNTSRTAGELARLIHESGLGNPHSTKLTEALRKSGHVIAKGSGFALKTLSRSKIREWLKPILGTPQPEV